jgi:hypothetical protein
MDVATAGRISQLRGKLSPSDLKLIDNCQLHSQDAGYHIGLPDSAFQTVGVLDQFLTWHPRILPKGTSISISSSRLNQKLDQQTDWFDALRTLAVQVAREPKFLVTSAGTTTNDFIERVSELFDIPLVEFTLFPDNPTDEWFKQIRNHDQPDNRATIFYKLRDDFVPAPRSPNVNDLLIQSAATSVLLSVRKGGHIENAVRHRLKHSPNPATRLLINRSLTTKSVETTLLESGATAWWLYEPAGSTTFSMHDIPHPRKCAILSADEFASDHYLIHYTRRRVGPWPDQTKPEFLDDLIFQTGRRNHSELASLCRILASKRILATNRLTRDRRPVVCFSEIPLSQLSQRRVFRPHLSRWDFEPFGMAFDRALLESLGARPAIYGTEQDWVELPAEDRPFFQVELSKSGQIDWQTEHEWRILGDVNLNQIPHDQAVVFVKTEADAQWVDAISRWPIVVLPSADQRD